MLRKAILLAWAAWVSATGATKAEDAPLAPLEAAKRMTLPDGFKATLFAGEPDVSQPIAFTFDDRGRMWVVECYSYPDWKAEPRDRVIIFEDQNGDGRFDSRKVFLENGRNLSGIALGHGGVWLCSLPEVVFVPDANGDDVPDAAPVVKLDGWDMNCKHNVFNSLLWGPDGWLYGCNGILATSQVGKPGAEAADRTPMNCGVWRYHPTRATFEVVAHGTTNPFGLDYDELGQMFFTNCVISHLWHVIPGAHYERMFGQDFNPYLYGLIQSCADHLHWAGGPWQSSRGGVGAHSDAGGGHAHVGALIYQGDNWPDNFRNRLFTCNLHGSRINQDLLERRGSGYVAHHGQDFMLANDPWFRGIAIHGGPDGGVYVSDWTDTGECHDYDDVRRENGRIYKITYGDPKPWSTDLSKLSDAELLKLFKEKNDWPARQARRLLAERAAAGKLADTTRPALMKLLKDDSSLSLQLRAIWALHGAGGVDEPLTMQLLKSRHDVVRGWAIQLALDDRQASSELLAKLAALAKEDPSAWVRLRLASGLQRLPLDDRWAIAEALAAHAEDAEDANLPLMIWYGIEPLVPASKQRALALVAHAKIPLLRQNLARRLASLTK